VENPLRKFLIALFHHAFAFGRPNRVSGHFLQAAVVIVQQSAHERGVFGMIEAGRIAQPRHVLTCGVPDE
jgi:hypothetical protein